MWSLTAHIAWLWLWLWLWLRLLNPLEFLQLNDCANGFPGELSPPLRITCAWQRFSPVNPHSILRFIQRIDQSRNRLAIVLCHDQSPVPVRQLLSQRPQRIRRKLLRIIRLLQPFSYSHPLTLRFASQSSKNR
jgi:hypothetical protein